MSNKSHSVRASQVNMNSVQNNVHIFKTSAPITNGPSTYRSFNLRNTDLLHVKLPMPARDWNKSTMQLIQATQNANVN